MCSELLLRSGLPKRSGSRVVYTIRIRDKITTMQIETITRKDLENLRHLQPEGWSDIIPDLTFYVTFGILQSN